jgi:acetolactate synthase II small subunit
MRHRVDVHLARADGSLVRLLGLAERRGYPPVYVSASPVGPDTQLVRLTLGGERPLEPLLRRLGAMYDVKHLETPR